MPPSRADMKNMGGSVRVERDHTPLVKTGVEALERRGVGILDEFGDQAVAEPEEVDPEDFPECTRSAMTKPHRAPHDDPLILDDDFVDPAAERFVVEMTVAQRRLDRLDTFAAWCVARQRKAAGDIARDKRREERP